MAKKSMSAGDELVLIAKAIRRAEKLERTLMKLVVLQDPQSPTEALLKAVQKGLKHFRVDETTEKDKSKGRAKKANAVENLKEGTTAPVIVKRIRKQTKSETSEGPAPKVS